MATVPGSLGAHCERDRSGAGRDRWRRRGVADSQQSMSSASAGHAVEQVGNELGVHPRRGTNRTSRVTGGTVIVVDRLIHGIDVDLAGAVAVHRIRDVAEQPGRLRLVVGAHACARLAVRPWLWVPITLSRPLTWCFSLKQGPSSGWASGCARARRSSIVSTRVTTTCLPGGAAGVRLARPARPI